MNQQPDPFSHHPELRDKISDPLQSFFRTFDIEKVAVDLAKQGLATGWWYSDAEREVSRIQALKGRGGSDLWIFGYGSLMWDPAFIFADVRKCRVPGYARRFTLKETKGGRGTPEAPGLVAALDKGEGCDGLVFKIAREIVEVETEILWRREMVAAGYVPTFVDAASGDERISALTFVADRDSEVIEPDLSHAKQIEYFATGAGILGTSLEYLENIAAQFDILGIEDENVSTLLRDTLAFIQTGRSGS